MDACGWESGSIGDRDLEPIHKGHDGEICFRAMSCATYLLLDSLADGGGELAGLVEARAQETRDLLDDRVGGQEGMVGLGCKWETKSVR